MAGPGNFQENAIPPIPDDFIRQTATPQPFWVGPVKLVLQIVRIVVLVAVALVSKFAIRQGGLPVALAILGGILALALISWLISRGITLLAADASREKPSRALAIFKLIVGVPLVVVSLLGLSPEWPIGLLSGGYLGPLYAAGFALLVAIGLHVVVMGAFALTGARPPAWLRAVVFMAVIGLGATLGPMASETYRAHQRSMGKIPLLVSDFGNFDYAGFAPDDKSVFLINGDGLVERWNLDAPRDKRVTVKQGEIGSSFWHATFSPNRRLLAWSRSSSSGVFDLVESKEVIRFEQRADCVAFDRDAKTVARGNSGVLSSAIELWDIPSASISRTIPVTDGRKITALAFNADGRRLYSGNEDGTVLVWNLADGSSKPFAKLSHSIYDLVVSPDGQMLAAAGHDLGIMILDAEKGETITHFNRHDKLVYEVIFTSDSRSVVSIGGVLDMLVIAWDARTGRTFFERPIPGTRHAIALSSDNKRLATSGDYHAYVWDISGVWPRD